MSVKRILGGVAAALVLVWAAAAGCQEIIRYSYDGMEQLIRTRYDDGTAVDYTYDRMGNRTSYTIAPYGSPENQPPSVPQSPDPANGSAAVDPRHVTLQWQSEDPDVDDVVFYDVYLGQIDPPPLYERTTETRLEIGALENLQTYYWRVVARDNRNAVAGSPLWHFDTINNPPDPPRLLAPLGDRVAAVNVVLSWSQTGDPNFGDIVVGYDLYFGTSAEPPLHTAGLTENRFVLGDLTPGATYYWKVAARDNHGDFSPDAEVRSFRVMETPPVVLEDAILRESTTLTEAEGPYIVRGTLSIVPEVTVSVEAGTVFKFEKGAKLRSEGTLLLEGESGREIVFTSAADDRYFGDTNGDADAVAPAPGDWNGVEIRYLGANQAIDVRHCIFEYGTEALTVYGWYEDGSITVSDNLFYRNSADAVHLKIAAATLDLLLARNRIESNGGRGIFAEISEKQTVLRGSIDNNQIVDNGGYGVFIYSWGYVDSLLDIRQNTVTGNGQYGIYAAVKNGSFFAQSNAAVVIGENFVSGSDTGICAHSYYGELDATVTGNQVTGCGNGIEVKLEMDAQISSLVNDNQVYQNTGSGVVISASSLRKTALVEVRGNQIDHNGGDGIEIDASHLEPVQASIALNEIYKNGGWGFYCRTQSAVFFARNDIYENSGAIHLYAVGSADILFNNFFENGSGYAVQNATGAPVDARYNYWGNLITEELQSSIHPTNLFALYDIEDDNTLGRIYHVPFQETALPVPAGPDARIIDPVSGSISKNRTILIRGIATAPAGVDSVHVSVDGGQSWSPASGREQWSYEWTAPSDGDFQILCRATDSQGNAQLETSAVRVSVDSTLPVTTRGALTSDETWSGEVVVTGDVIVPEGVVLTIAGDTTVRFQTLHDQNAGGNDPSRSELIVRGSLIADGAVFTSADTGQPAAGDWGGIFVTAGGGNSEITLTDAVVEYGNIGLSVLAAGATADVNVSHCTFRHNAGDALSIAGSSGVTLNLDLFANHIESGPGRGITASITDSGSTLTGSIRENQLQAANTDGIAVYTRTRADANLEISANTVTNATVSGTGILVNNDPEYQTSGYSELTLRDNVLDGGGTGIRCLASYSRMNVRISGNELRNAYREGLSISTGSDGIIEAAVQDNEIHDNGSSGMRIEAGAWDGSIYTTVRGNRIYLNSGIGIELFRDSRAGVLEPLVTLNTIYQNSGSGLACLTTAALDVLYNDVHGNTGGGLKLQSGEGTHVNYNNLHANGNGYALQNDGAFAIDARFNFWGDSTVAEMQAAEYPANIGKIYDKADQSEKGNVSYADWLQTPIAVPQAPTSRITFPVEGSVQTTAELQIRGIAVAPAGVDAVEISFDQGQTWTPVNGVSRWSLPWTAATDGPVEVLSRATDAQGLNESDNPALSFTVDTNRPTTSGSLSKDEVWQDAVTLTGDVVVPAGYSLTIEPGTVVRFLARSDDRNAGRNTALSELIVHGSLTADQVTFTSSSSTPQAGDWGGVRIMAATGTTAIAMIGATVEYAENGITVESSGVNADVTLSANQLQSNSGSGVTVKATNGADLFLTISDNRVTGSGMHGIHLHAKHSGTVLNGTVQANTVVQKNRPNTDDAGIHLHNDTRAYSQLEVSENTVQVTTRNGFGIMLLDDPDWNTHCRSDLTVTNNTVQGGTAGIRLKSFYSDMIADVVGNEVFDAYLEGISVTSYHSTVVAAVEWNVVHGNRRHGIRISSDAWDGNTISQVRGNRIYANGGNGIHLFRDDRAIALNSVVVLNHVYENGDFGIFCQTTAPVDMLYNDFHGNVGGLNVSLGAGAHLNYNNIYDNAGGRGLQNTGSAFINARYNYWGASTTADMETGIHPRNLAAIYDGRDKSAYGVAAYEPWLSSALILPSEPIAQIIFPFDGSLQKHTAVPIEGIAAAPAGVERVEISFDGGGSWFSTVGGNHWQYDWTAPGDGSFTILSRAYDRNGEVQTSTVETTITVDSNLPVTTAGALISDETWSGEVRLAGDVIVPPGMHLTIEPGTTVFFPTLEDIDSGGNDAGRSELIVSGTLRAENVVFTSTSANGSPSGDWGGIRLKTDNENASLELSDCVVEYAATGVQLEAVGRNASAGIEGATIRYSGSDGISIHVRNAGVATLSLSENSIEENIGYGVVLHATGNNSKIDGFISGSTVSNRGDIGIFVNLENQARADLEIAENRIFGHRLRGIALATNWYSATYGNFTIRQNTIYDSDMGISFGNRFGEQILNLLRNEIYQVGTGILIQNAVANLTADLEGNLIHHSRKDGISIDTEDSSSYTSDIGIRENQIYGNTGYGIHLVKTAPAGNFIESLIDLNTIQDNGKYGIYLESDRPVRIFYNTIRGNAGGIYRTAGGGDRVQFNDLYDNPGNLELRLATSASLDARFNFWGASMSPQLESGDHPRDVTFIHDNYDQVDIGTADYADWLSESIETLDSDQDELPNVWEYANGLDPFSGDSDADGFDDGAEVALGSDPLDPERIPSSVYEDAEDESTAGWSVYTGEPAGATVSNVYDEQRGSRVIVLERNGYQGFRLSRDDGTPWDNEGQFVLFWRMQTAGYTLFVEVETTAGPRYLKYNAKDYSSLGDAAYVHHGLGADSDDGTWRTFARDLQADLQAGQPEVAIVRVKGLLLTGSGRFDDIRLVARHQDNDSDGLADFDEVNLVGTDSDWFDSDGDGLGDGEEIDTYGTDPKALDSDGDGLSDGDEFALWGDGWSADPDGDGFSAIVDPDSDGDGPDDGEEMRLGYDPGDAASTPALVYEDAEDADTAGWFVFDNSPGGAFIQNVFDEQRGSRVIETVGSSTSNGYQLKKADGNLWCNPGQHVVSWRMKYPGAVFVYVEVMTTDGRRYLQYSPVNDDPLGAGEYIVHGIGAEVILDGQWHHYVRDLQADLQHAQPEAEIIEVNSFIIRGTGRVDDIRLMKRDWDGDGDGLTDFDEVNVFGTDPDRVDTDGDGQTDAEENIL